MTKGEKAEAHIRQDLGALTGEGHARLLREIEQIIVKLDRGGEHVAAAHVQMARDLLATRDDLERGTTD